MPDNLPELDGDPFRGDEWGLPEDAAPEWKLLHHICFRVRNGDLVWEHEKDGWDHELGLRGYIAIRRLYTRLEANNG